MGLTAFLDSLPAPARRGFVALWGGCFIVLVFGLIPSWAVDANRELGWPRWQSGAGRVLGAAALPRRARCRALLLATLRTRGPGHTRPDRPAARARGGGPVPPLPQPHLRGAGRRAAELLLLVGRAGLLLYAGLWALGVQLVIVWIEEPDLRNRFGEPYVAYTRQVPRWIGRTGHGG